MTQIKYLGILETIQIRQQGFPCRMRLEEFYEKYHELDEINRHIRYQKHLQMKTDFQKLVKEILQRVVKNKNIEIGKMILFGKTKIYFKQEVASEIDEKYLEWCRFKGVQAGKI